MSVPVWELRGDQRWVIFSHGKKRHIAPMDGAWPLCGKLGSGNRYYHDTPAASLWLMVCAPCRVAAAQAKR
jgi:hypothetical protein